MPRDKIYLKKYFLSSKIKNPKYNDFKYGHNLKIL